MGCGHFLSMTFGEKESSGHVIGLEKSHYTIIAPGTLLSLAPRLRPFLRRVIIAEAPIGTKQPDFSCMVI